MQFCVTIMHGGICSFYFLFFCILIIEMTLRTQCEERESGALYQNRGSRLLVFISYK